MRQMPGSAEVAVIRPQLDPPFDTAALRRPLSLPTVVVHDFPAGLAATGLKVVHDHTPQHATAGPPSIPAIP